MNTEQLETFLALAETKNFSRCAQRLIISQSAVSKRIFELEKELGQTLFHRSGGVALTGEGRAFRPYAEQMLNLREQAAERLGKSQSAIANKLRLLRLSPDCVRLLREHDLSERHARALLRLTDEEDRLKALQVIAARGYNVAQSEAYIEELLKLKQKTPPPRLPTYVIKDVRIFLNTIRRSIDVMQRAGVQADVQRQDSEEDILLTIRIPKRAKEAG